MILMRSKAKEGVRFRSSGFDHVASHCTVYDDDDDDVIMLYSYCRTLLQQEMLSELI